MMNRNIYYCLFDRPGYLQGIYAGKTKAIIEKSICKEFEIESLEKEGFSLRRASLGTFLVDELRWCE